MLRKISRSIGAVLPGIILDAAGIAGVGLVAYGAWMIYPPAGFITGGVLVLAGVLLSSGKTP